MLWKRVGGFSRVSPSSQRREKMERPWDAMASGREEQRRRETRNMERLFAMVDKRTLDIFHCQHFVGPTLLLSPIYDMNRRTILDRTKFVRKFVSVVESNILGFFTNGPFLLRQIFISNAKYE